jgi:hypothetical protein
MPSLQSDEMLETLKRVASALRDADVEFLVGGGIAAWARGGPPTEHDIDFVIREADVDRALDSCAAAGMRTDRPPEGWLVKAWDGDVLIDLIFRPTGLVADDALFTGAETLNVHAVPMLVMSADDLMTTKLLALTEHNLDYAPVLEYARSLREQINWTALHARTEGSPFARAFFTLVSELGVCRWSDETTAAGAAKAHQAAVSANG